ncbi:MAG: S8/S53 family peptidase [Anaerolineae bacterium]|nr:S8/S53 family peptidase [Anaerolineae bacterium]
MEDLTNETRAFAPHQIVYLVTHPPDATPSEVVDFLKTFLASNECLVPEIDISSEKPPLRFVSEASLSHRLPPVTYIAATYPRLPDADLFKEVLKIYRILVPFREPSSAERFFQPILKTWEKGTPSGLQTFLTRTGRGIHQIYWKLRRVTGNRQDYTPREFELLGASPNWLSNGAPNEPPAPPDSGTGGGGPAGNPVAATLDKPTDYRFSVAPTGVTGFPANLMKYYEQAFGFKSNNPNAKKSVATVIKTFQNMLQMMLEHPLPKDAVKPQKVRVVILDTAPPSKDPNPPEIEGKQMARNAFPISLSEAYNQFGNTNPLLESLLRSTDTATGLVEGLRRDPVTKEPKSDILRITYFADPVTGETFDAKPTVQRGYELHRACVQDQDFRQWKMDHGLFAAGIIHSISPGTELHLVEVLNAFGSGTLMTYLAGLDTALKGFDPANEKLVINLSLTFSVPANADHPDAWLKELYLALDQGDAEVRGLLDSVLVDVEQFLTYLSLPITLPMAIVAYAQANLNIPSSKKNVLDGLLKLYHIQERIARVVNAGGVVVAAAGNDGLNGGKSRTPARMPASMPTVLGVAALDSSNNQLTDYSNLADYPVHAGVAVFGGDIDSANPKFSNAKTGILGVYTGPYPENPPDLSKEDWQRLAPNATGWARWSGTSFAAPIISGLIAEMMSRGWSGEEALTILRIAFPEQYAHEHVIRLKQG